MGQSVEYGGVEEAELICGSLSGDRRAFGELVERYQNRIFVTVYRMLGSREDAQDLAQETFLRAFGKLGSFRQGARFSTWLYTIALNLARSELRKRKVRKGRRPLSLQGGDDPGILPVSEEPAPVEVLGRRELYRLALSAMEELDPEAREVVVLRDMQDLSYEEIAGVLGCPIGTVRSRLHRARLELRERLAPHVEVRRKGGAA